MADIKKPAKNIIEKIEESLEKLKKEGAKEVDIQEVSKYLEEAIKNKKSYDTVVKNINKLKKMVSKDASDKLVDRANALVEVLNDLELKTSIIMKPERVNTAEFEKLSIDEEFDAREPKDFVNQMENQVKLVELNEKIRNGVGSKEDKVEMTRIAGELFGEDVFPAPGKVLKNVAPLINNATLKTMLEDMIAHPEEALQNPDELAKKASELKVDSKELTKRLNELKQKQELVQEKAEKLLSGGISKVSKEDMYSMLQRAQSTYNSMAKDEEVYKQYSRATQDPVILSELKSAYEKKYNQKKRDLQDLSHWNKDTRVDKAKAIEAQALKFSNERKELKDQQFIKKLDARAQKKKKGFFKLFSRKNANKNLETSEKVINKNRKSVDSIDSDITLVVDKHKGKSLSRESSRTLGSRESLNKDEGRDI
ncbi:MAG: hypothetical protein J6Y29_00705 [Clostridiales bacterium]|nr:hypothetical protein [Clostridiales bacterium]